MKIIFLDIDGVLNNPGTYNKPEYKTYVGWFEPEKVKLLNRIIKETGANIVLSSAWRHFDDRYNALMLAFMGVEDKYIARTRMYSPPHEYREHEIAEFLSTWKESHKEVGPFIENFIILDDDTDMGELMPHLVKVNGAWGLSEDNVTQAIERLNALPPHVK